MLDLDSERKRVFSNEEIEDNIIRYLSNIKIVKDTTANSEDDELDKGMQNFLVEMLNDTCKIRDLKKVENKSIGTRKTIEVNKANLEKEKVKMSLLQNVVNIQNNDISIKKEIDKQQDIILEKKRDTEIIEKKAIKDNDELDDEKLDDLVIEKLIENNSYEKFYKVIKYQRNDTINKKVIALVVGMLAIIFTIMFVVTGVVTAASIM